MNNSSLVVATIVFLIGLLACPLALGCGPTSPSAVDNALPEVIINDSYYQLDGTSEAELRRQMDRLGPADQGHRPHDAYTAWHVGWSYPHLTTNDHCAIGPISVTVTISHTWPQWKTPPQVSPTLLTKWERYLEALDRHEAGHRRIRIEAGRAISQILSRLPTYPTCAQLEQAADRQAEAILAEFRRQERDYDQTTGHGRTQGAQFGSVIP